MLYIFNSKSFIFSINFSLSFLFSSSICFSLEPFFCSSIIFLYLSISFCLDVLISFNFDISLSLEICNFLYSSICPFKEDIYVSSFKNVIIFCNFFGTSEFIEINSALCVFNKESKKDIIDSEFASYIFYINII
jgi:hypothetical protein